MERNGISFLLGSLMETAENSKVEREAIYVLRDLLDAVVEDMKADFRIEEEGQA